MLYEAMQEVLQPIMGCRSIMFIVQWKGYGEWNWFPVILSYCFDISERKDISCVKHGM